MNWNLIPEHPLLSMLIFFIAWCIAEVIDAPMMPDNYGELSPLNVIGNPCPKCKEEMKVKLDMFYWRGKSLSGLVCENCNALFDNPKDSFMEYVNSKKELTLKD